MTLRPRGLWLVTSLELRQRVRSVRWYVALGVWFLVLMVLAVLVFGLTGLAGGLDGPSMRATGAVVFSITILMLIFATLLISPALASGAINGDRTAGTLATLQATLLSPLEIVLGKVLAGWLTGLAFLLAALPSVVPSALMAGVGPFYLLRVLIAVSVLTLFFTAIGVGLSSVTARQLGSVVLTYLVVLGTTAILPLVYVCTFPLLTTEREVTSYTPEYVAIQTPDGSPAEDAVFVCKRRTEPTKVLRTDIGLPLLIVNPFVIVADQTPPLTDRVGVDEEVDVLRLMTTGVRYLAHPLHPSRYNSCSPEDEGYPKDLGSPTDWPVWPLGIAAWGAAAGGAVALATWRLRTPMRRVGAGTRIA